MSLTVHRLSGLSKANLQGRDLTRGGLTLIYERHALHKCVKDCGSLRLECFRIEDLDDERLTRPQRESRHSVSVADVRQTIDPCIHVPPVECWEAENGRRLVVKGIPIADCCAVQLNECHFSFEDQCWRLTPKLSCKRSTSQAAHQYAGLSSVQPPNRNPSDVFALVSCSDSLDSPIAGPERLSCRFTDVTCQCQKARVRTLVRRAELLRGIAKVIHEIAIRSRCAYDSERLSRAVL